MGILALYSASADISLLGRYSKATVLLHRWPPLTVEVEGCDMVMAHRWPPLTVEVEGCDMVMAKVLSLYQASSDTAITVLGGYLVTACWL